MKRLKVFLGIMLVLLAVVIPTGTSVKAGSSDFEVTTSVSAINEGKAFDAVLEITNKGKDFTGYARIVVNNRHYKQTGYDVDISIPANSTKQYTVTIPKYGFTNDEASVYIYDNNGKKVYDRFDRSFFGQYSNTLNVGVLSDNASVLSFLDGGGQQYEYNTQKFKIKMTEVDANVTDASLAGLDILIINDFDTSSLSKDSMNAINNWIGKGNYLLIGTGALGAKTLAGFDLAGMDILNVGGTYNAELCLNYYTDATNTQFTPDILDIEFGNSFSYYSLDYIRVKTYLGGCLGVSTIDLADLNQNVTKEYMNDLIQSLLMMYKQYVPGGDTDYDNGIIADGEMIGTYMGYMEKPAKTGTGLVSAIIVFYVILVGPVLYLVLKAIKQREKMWIIIPALSILFVGIIFLISFSVRVKGLQLKSVNIKNLTTGEDTSVIFGYSPTPDKWTVTTKEDKAYGTSVSEWSGGLATSEVESTIKNNGGKLELTYNPTTTFKISGFYVTGNDSQKGGLDLELNDVAKSMGFSELSELTSAGAGFNGYVTLTNTTGIDFDYVYIYTNNGSQLIEGLKNGTTVDVTYDHNNNVYTYNQIHDYVAPEYKRENYDKSAELAALMFGTYNRTQKMGNNGGFGVAGIVKSDSITDKNESSWTVYLAE